MCFELEAGLGLVAIAAMRRAKLEMVFKSRTAARESAPKPFDESQVRVQKADFEANTSYTGKNTRALLHTARASSCTRSLAWSNAFRRISNPLEYSSIPLDR